MAWIESHQELREHPKTYRLMEALKISKRDAVGLLQMLWWWSVDNATDGHIRQPAVAIKSATEWETSADELVAGLVSAGWLDAQPEGGWLVHDWLVYCGELVKKRLERKVSKDRKASAKRPPNGRRAAEKKPPTVSQSVSVSVSQPVSKDTLPGLSFADFWKSYPKKQAKADAQKAWDKINPDQPTVRWILTSLNRAKDSRDWTKDHGQFVPYPATWLNGKRWEDFEPPAVPKPRPPAPPPAAPLPPLSEERKRELDEHFRRIESPQVAP